MLKKARIIGGALVVPVILSALLGVVYLVLAQEGGGEADLAAQFALAQAHREAADAYRSDTSAKLRESEYVAAETIYQNIIANYPGTENAFKAQVELTRTFLFDAKPSEAEATREALMRDFATHEQLPQAVYELGRQYRGAGNRKEALRYYRMVAETWPQATCAFDARRNAAILCFELHACEEGELIVNELIRLMADNGETAWVAREVGKWEERHGRYPQAIYYYEQANTIGAAKVADWYSNRDATEMQGRLMLDYLLVNNENAASGVFQNMVSHFQSDYVVANTIRRVAGEYYMKKGLYAKALEYYQYIIEHWPAIGESTVKFQRDLAEVQFRVGNLQAVDAAIGKMIANLSADDDDMREILSIAGIVGRGDEAGSHVRAKNLYQYVLDETDNQSAEIRFQAYNGLIRIAIDMTDFSEAESVTNRFIGECGADPAMSRTLFGFAGAYQKIGATQEAKRLYKEITRLRFDSSNSYTQGELKEMDQIYIEILRKLKDEERTSEEALAAAYNCLEVFQNAEENNKLSYVALEFAAAGFRDAKRLELGTEEIEKIISVLNPTTEPYRLACAHCTRGVLLSWQHRRLEAIEAFEKAAVDTGENMSKVHQDLCSLALGEAYQITAYHFHRKAKAQEYLQEIRTRWPDGRFEDRIQECNRYVYKR